MVSPLAATPRAPSLPELLHDEPLQPTLHPAHVVQDLLVRDPEYLQPQRLHVRVALRVVLLLPDVAAAVHLHHQPEVADAEVGDVVPDDQLPGEVQPVELSLVHLLPEDHLGQVARLPEFSRIVAQPLVPRQPGKRTFFDVHAVDFNCFRFHLSFCFW